jgi:hypothetical protein
MPGPRHPTHEIQERYGYINLDADGTTTVKEGSGILAGIIVNGGTLGSITIYDSLAGSGTKIATIASPTAGMALPYSCEFKTGLTIILAADTDITVVYA